MSWSERDRSYGFADEYELERAGELYTFEHKECKTSIAMATIEDAKINKCGVCKKPFYQDGADQKLGIKELADN